MTSCYFFRFQDALRAADLPTTGNKTDLNKNASDPNKNVTDPNEPVLDRVLLMDQRQTGTDEDSDVDLAVNDSTNPRNGTGDETKSDDDSGTGKRKHTN